MQTTTQRGQVASDMRGNSTSLQSTLTYYADTGRLSTVCSGTNCALQDLQYHFDAAGNLDARSRAVHGATTSESFTYDAINRLKSAGLVKISGVTQTTIPTLGLTYDQLGNICTKSPLSGGTVVYQYAGLAGCANHGSIGSPHAAIYVGGVAYGYDTDGNQTTNGNGRAISYNALNQVTTSVDNGVTVSFQYGPDGDRFQRTDSDSGVLTYYIGKAEIRSLSGSFNVRRYLGGVAIDYVRATTTNETRYTFADHLGSMDVFASSSGQVIESESFDAHGNRRDPATWEGTAAPPTSTAFGFTNQEHVDSQSFIHMNGRIYDPTLGRMLQADPIRNPGSQGLNRYSYVANNPLTLTDPSGNSWFSDILRAAAGIAIAIFAPELIPATWGYWATMGAYAAIGFVSGYVSTGTLQGALAGAFTGALFYGIGQGFDNATWAHEGGTIGSTNLNSIGFASKILAHGIAGGVMSELEGGKFGNGFLSAGISEAAGPEIDKLDPENPIGQAVSAERVVASAIVGGTTSALTGGNFANGAVTSAFGRAFNEESLWQRTKAAASNAWSSYIEPGLLNGGRALLAEGRAVAGFGEFVLGDALSDTLVGAPLGIPLMGYGVANMAGAASDYSNIFGYNNNWNFIEKGYSYLSVQATGNDYGPQIFLATDTLFNGYNYLRSVPVIYNVAPPLLEGSGYRSFINVAPLPAVANDAAQAVKGVSDANSEH